MFLDCDSRRVVIAGKEKKDRILSPSEKKTVAYHEVGHALITALEKNSEPVQKITIVPRTMGALGYVMQVPEEEKYLISELLSHKPEDYRIFYRFSCIM